MTKSVQSQKNKVRAKQNILFPKVIPLTLNRSQSDGIVTKYIIDLTVKTIKAINLDFPKD